MRGERRKKQVVSDPPAENRLKVNNILLTMVLVMGSGFGSWIGLNIEKLKDLFFAVSTAVHVHESRLDRVDVDVIGIKNALNKHNDRISSLEREYNGKR